MNLKNKKIANAWDHISDVYESTRECIEDERYLDRFDKIMDSLETEQDMEDFFEEVVLEYLNDEVAPDDYEFGIHARSGEIGFWRVNDKTGELDMFYPGMPKPPPVRLLNPEDEEEDDDEEEEEEEDVEDTDEEPEPQVSGDEEKKKEGVAEVLDETGQVVAHTSFREGTPESDQEGVEERREREVS